MAFVSVNRAGILADVADVIDAAWKGVEIAVFDGLQGGNAQLGDVRDLLQGDPFGLTNVSYPPLLKRRSRHAPLHRRLRQRPVGPTSKAPARRLLPFFGYSVVR